jgi:hypothetical protein
MRRRLRLFLLIGVLLALVGGITIDVWTRRQLDSELARVESRYGSLHGRTLVAPPVADEYNSARFVRAAAALTIHPGARPYGVLMASAREFEKLPESSIVPRDLQAFVDANTEAMRLAGEAIDRHQSSWDADYGEAGNGYAPRLLDIRTLSDAIALAAVLDRKAGRADEASRKTAAGLAVAASIRHEPSLISQLIRIAIAARQCEAIQSLIAGSEPSKAALEALARTLRENAETDPMRVGLLAELRYGHGLLVAMERQPLGRIGRPFVRLAKIHYLREMERLLELQAGPRPHPPFPEQPRYGRLDWRRLTDNVLPGLWRAIDSGDQYNSVLGVTDIGVALRRYRLDRGNYPEELSAVVPEYLTRLPIDPVTGRPPAYARSGAGFTLKAEPIRKGSSANAALEWVVAR